LELAKELASKSPVALKMGKETFYVMSDMEYFKAQSYSRERFLGLSKTEDALKGVKALFGEKTACVERVVIAWSKDLCFLLIS
jgi:enoyl-CoA hydratase/carnithine racemase